MRRCLMSKAKLVPTPTRPRVEPARRERLRIIMRQAWAWARHGANRFGGRPAQYLAQALRIVWAEKRRIAREHSQSRAPVPACGPETREQPGVAAPPRPAYVRPLRRGRGFTVRC